LAGVGNAEGADAIVSVIERRNRFEAIVLPHLDAAYRLARWLSSSPADADDVVQEAILRAYRGFDALKGEGAKAWLLVIVRNCHLSALQQRRRRPAESLPEESDVQDALAMTAASPGPEEEAVAADERSALVRLMRALPEDHREVLILRDIEDMSYREIAGVIGAPIGTVMSRLARARAALKAQWFHAEGKSHAVR
jgi:RNA polymerase sigma-70 factor (ECF subfamily)